MPETLLIPLATIGGATIAAIGAVLTVNRFQKNGNQKGEGRIIELLTEIRNSSQEHTLNYKLFNQRVEEMFTTLKRDNGDILDAIGRHRQEPHQG